MNNSARRKKSIDFPGTSESVGGEHELFGSVPSGAFCVLFQWRFSTVLCVSACVRACGCACACAHMHDRTCFYIHMYIYIYIRSHD